MRHSLLGYVHGRLELPATERLKLAQNKTPAKVRFGDKTVRQYIPLYTNRTYSSFDRLTDP